MVTTTNLVSYYKCDENAANTTVADSHGSNTGTASANTSTIYNASGKINSGFDLELSVPDFVTLGAINQNEISISAWIKMESNGGSESLIVSGFEGTFSFVLGINETSGSIYPYWKVITAGGSNAIESPTAISLNTWYHIVGTWDSSTGGVLYVNNVNKGSINTFSGVMVASTDAVFIGKLRSSDSLYAFDGIIDEVAIFDAPISSTDVSDLYNSGSGLAYPFVSSDILESDTTTISDSLTITRAQKQVSLSLDDTANISDNLSITRTNKIFNLDLSDTTNITESLEVCAVSDIKDYIVTKVTIDGVQYDDYQNMNIVRSQSDSNSTSNCNIVLDSPYGRHSDDFNIGQEIQIYADDYCGATRIFRGILEKKKFTGKGTNQKLTLSGRDFMLRLMDMTAEPQVFTNTELSDIIKALISNNNVPDITTTNVQTTDFIHPRFPVNHQSIFDAICELAQLADYVFYVDLDKDLHFEPRRSISSGITLDNTNILSSTFDNSRTGMANRIWVYGDRYLSGFKQDLISDGTSDYTLSSKPHNTQIELAGSTLKGSITGITLTPTSGPDYSVSFDDKLISFLSGTDLGYSSIPNSGTGFTVNYQRELPIVKFGQNDTSIKLFGPKNLVFRDKSIRDPNAALEILKGKLRDSDPLNRINNKIKGWFDLNPGETVAMNLADFNLVEDAISIVQISYNFDKRSVNEKTPITLTLSKKFVEITDQIKDVKNRIEAIESQETQSSDTITRLITGKDEMMIVGSHYNIQTSTVTGSAYHLYATNFVPPVNPWHLASGTNQGILSGSPVGSAFGPFTIVASGGNNYDVTGSYNPGGSEAPGGFGIQSFG